ncbi:uncharacterized protein LOC124928923 [Impatiens glandulifera]|uniref:uncharacterized protein LOC124928923 n=1 Tax=Impatiens glandulifera TaxID=253017 RepID=UPI001FB096A5|nr:uncharacterized protein LOC124928923 [Impatiens glandulifera]
MDYESSIEEEKAKAISRNRRIQKFARIWWLVEVFVAIILLLSFPLISLPISTNSFYNFSFRRITGIILNPHINFIVGNAIIVVLFLLSRQNNVGGNEVSNESNLDSNEETQTVSNVVEIETEFPSCPAAAAVVVEEEEEKIVDVEAKLVHCEAVTNAIEDATKQIRRFERTQSEKLRRELRTKQRERFRRSESEIGVRRSSREDESSSSSSVNDLSNEEFRRKIEKFIENEKNQIRAQRIAEKIF